MNALGIALVWCVLQVTLASAIGVAVYLVARKAGWAAGRMAAIASLAVVFLLTTAALSPWPSWFSSEEGSVARGAVNRANAFVEDSSVQAEAGTTVAEFVAKPEGSGPLNLAFWHTVWAEMHPNKSAIELPTAVMSSVWRWPAIVAALFLGTVGVGLLRLLIAWFAVRQLDGKSTKIDDSHLTELAAALSRQLSLSRRFELKESSELQTAATFGWRRPVVLLPSTWRDWPVEELRAVLAHEMAHIRNGDFLTWLLAQGIVTTHFYHPLVHWLAGRLRLEQELAADATAAQFAGGRETYLQSLATLTLRADHLRPSWATQTFLPTRSMFVRRIEMLKRTKMATSEKLSGKVRLAVLGSLAAIGFFAVGLRAPGPIGAAAAIAAETEHAILQAKIKPPKSAVFHAKADMRHIPESALFVMRIRPCEIFQEETMQLAAKEVNQFLAGWPGWDFFSVEKIDTILVATYEVEPGEPGARYLFRMKKPINKTVADRILQAYMPLGTVEVEHPLGGTYYHEKGDEGGPIYSRIDDRTFIFDSSRDSFLRHLHRLTSREMPLPNWLGNAKPEATTQLWCALNSQKFVLPSQEGELIGGFPLQFISPLFRDMQRLVASVQIGPTIDVQADAACLSPEAAERVKETAAAMFVMLRNMLTEQQLASKVRAKSPVVALAPVLKLLQTLLEEMQVEATEKNVRLTTTTKWSSSKVFQTLFPMMREARKSAKKHSRQMRGNNIKQIALALMFYQNEHGHFPPAVLYDKKTGTPYSWRIAILPYMEQHIHGQYQFGEPWDSEHNLKIAKTVMPTYSSPTEQISNKTAYFLLTGPETIFAGKEGVKLQQVTDGTSNTILVVEAKRDIPWTKPEDISYAPGKPLPKLGGFFKGGFHVAFCDGSIHFMADDVDPKTLRNLIERADGNAVDWPAFQK